MIAARAEQIKREAIALIKARKTEIRTVLILMIFWFEMNIV
jgi:hypothetical protein